jgi:hypothetical protein
MWWRVLHPAASGVGQWRLVSCSPKSVVIKITHWIIFAGETPRLSIFVGSSSADRALALQVAQYLTSLPGVVGKCMVEEFPLRLLTFEALERMLCMCAGTVFILVTADNNGRPNDNVLIEVGLVSGRMGRTRVAICTNGGVHLLSDLDCRIENIASSPDAKTAEAETGAGASMISSSARERLKDWANYLPAILHGSPCTQVLHGYSGHWRVVLSF